MSDMKVQIANQLHEAQSKYTYFLLAVAASCIALAVQRTTGTRLTWQHALLGLAVVAWLGSFFAGCRNREYFSSALYANLASLQLEDGTHPEAPSHPELVRAAYDGVLSAAKYNSSSANFWGLLQFRLLVGGAMLFLVWHVVDMQQTISNQVQIISDGFGHGHHSGATPDTVPVHRQQPLDN